MASATLAAASSLWRPAVLTFLRARKALERRSPRLTAINIFEAESASGLMRQFIVEEMIESWRMFVAPISRISFERMHPIRLQIAANQRCRASGGASQWKCDSSLRGSP
jgi:hypothetical protein